MRRALTPAVALLALAVPATAPAAVREPDAAWVAVQNARSGSLTHIAGTRGDYRLVLRGAAPTVKTFDDSPGDAAGDVTVRTLLDGLFHAGGGTEHNAGITVGRRTMGVLLLGGSYNARTRTMQYRVRALDGGDRLPRTFARPVLFIDDVDATAPPATCHVIAHLPAQHGFVVVSGDAPGQTWTAAPALLSPSYATWTSVAPTGDCSSTVTLRATAPGFSETAVISVSSAGATATTGGTSSCSVADGVFPYLCPSASGTLAPGFHSFSFTVDGSW